MFSEKDILARLQAGEDAQKIADEMAKMLNAAIDQKKAEDEAAKKIAETKVADLQAIIDEFKLWMETYTEYKDLDEVFQEFNATKLIEIMNEVDKSLKAFDNIKVKIGTPVKKATVKVASDAEKVLDDFLKQMGW